MFSYIYYDKSRREAHSHLSSVKTSSFNAVTGSKIVSFYIYICFVPYSHVFFASNFMLPLSHHSSTRLKLQTMNARVSFLSKVVMMRFFLISARCVCCCRQAIHVCTVRLQCCRFDDFLFCRSTFSLSSCYHRYK